MSEKINKGTEAEKFVYDLSKDKLLEEYCLLNPFVKGEDKEVADLLIICNNSCIIVSVKNHAFTGNQDRFEKKVFQKSKDQLLGAKRRLLLKSKCTLIGKNSKEKEFDANSIQDYILITLNFGHELESYKIIEYENEIIIHNLDKDTFETIIFELDSVPEIIDYFTKKEILYKKDISLNIIGKEKDLLAWFVTNKREFPKEWFGHKATEVLLDIDGRWDFYDTHEETIAKRKANKISYFVDELVKREIPNLPQCQKVGDYLMSLSRVERRLFSMAFFDHCHENKAKGNDFLSRRLIFDTFQDASCLMLYYHSSLTEIELDQFLQITAEIYLYKNSNRHKKLVVVGTSKDLSPFKFGFLERYTEYSREEINYYEGVIKRFGWFTDVRFSNIGLKEYPNQNNV
jgi:hypothetical protein